MMFPYRLYPKRSESGTNRIRANPERIRDNESGTTTPYRWRTF